MKLAMIMSVFGKNAIGGAERTAELLAHNLALRGHELLMISLGPINSTVQKYQLKPGIQAIQIPLAQSYDPYGLDAQSMGQAQAVSHSALQKALWHLKDVYNARMGSAVRDVLELEKPDVVMTHTLQGFSVAVWDEAKRVGAKLIHMTHDHALICPSTAMTKGAKVCEAVCLQCAIYGKLRHAFAASPDVVIGPSQIILDRHRQFGWFKEVKQFQVIANALPPEWPDIPALTPKTAPTNQMVFGFMGRLDESKGVDTLLQALKHLPPERYHLKIGGYGHAEQVRSRWLDASVPTQSVEFLGLVKAAEFIQTVDVMVVPSRAHETFCNVAMEATCSGRPCIVSNRGALPERVEQGRAGWIFEAGDSAKLAQVMQHCMDSPTDVLDKGHYGRSLKPHYSPKQQCDQLESLLLSLQPS